ncbi:MAG: zf-HC2 domain-containing protein, partial [Bryobacteraceae bacterium]
MVKWTKGPNASEPHLETSRLVLFIDGQLSKAESAAAQSHLDLCDSCRAELAGIQDALSAYVDYRKCEYSEGLTPPPNGWRHFDGKLRQCAIDLAHTAPRSVFKEAVPSRTANARFHNLFRLPIDRIPVPVLAGVAFALLVVFTLFFFLKSAGKLSAAEIITKATSVQNRNASAIRRPIVYRKVRLRRISSRPDPDASITMETWIDELSENSRVRESVGKWSRISSMNRHQSAQSVPVHPADTRSRHAAPGITAQ